jgi:uncharacterized Tic20 family protein
MEAPAAAPTTEVSKDAKTMAMLSHLLAIFFGFIPPLIIWLVKKEESPFIEDQAKESLNFQITMAIAWFAAFILTFLVIGALLMPALLIANLVLCIIAALKANEGVAYRYPFALRLIK